MNQPSNQTRRDFLKQSAGVVAAASAASATLLRAPAAYGAAADETIKIGLIGCGGRGTGAAVQALSHRRPGRSSSPIADAFEDNAEERRRQPQERARRARSTSRPTASSPGSTPTRR